MPIALVRLAVICAIPLVSACEGRTGDSNAITDGGLDGGTLADGVANIWVDPDGCQHWYIDDGLEGYMTPRLNRDGTPRCVDQDERSAMIAKDGATIQAEPEPQL